MNCQTCACDAARCECCTGVTTMTPANIENRPGLPALRYRIGSHGRFLASMKARLPMMEMVAPGKDNQTLESFRPLQALTTRDPADPAIPRAGCWFARSWPFHNPGMDRLHPPARAKSPGRR